MGKVEKKKWCKHMSSNIRTTFMTTVVYKKLSKSYYKLIVQILFLQK